MVSRFMEGVMNTVDPVAVFKLLHRFSNTHPAETIIQINFGTEHFFKFPTPHSYLHLIMCIVDAGIKGEFAL